MWVPVPPSAQASLAGATVLANLSASPVTVGRSESRRQLVQSASNRCNAAYLYTAAGQGESTTDLSWDGQTMIYENGVLLAETGRFPQGDQYAVADIDLDLLRQARQRMGTFDDNRRAHAARTGGFRHVSFRLEPPTTDVGLRRRLERFPFVPSDAARLAQDCIRSVEILEYPELGMEAVWKIEVEDFPAFIVVDDKGNDFFTDPSGAVTVPLSGIRVRSDG